MAKNRRLPPVHPGEVLREDLMTPLGLSINGLARDLRVPVTRMSEIVNGRRSITADTALRLARYFAMTPQFWMNLQAAYDLDLATRARIGGQNQTKRASARGRVGVHEVSTLSDRQNAMIDCSIGAQPFIPEVYGVNAPL